MDLLATSRPTFAEGRGYLGYWHGGFINKNRSRRSPRICNLRIAAVVGALTLVFGCTPHEVVFRTITLPPSGDLMTNVGLAQRAAERVWNRPLKLAITRRFQRVTVDELDGLSVQWGVTKLNTAAGREERAQIVIMLRHDGFREADAIVDFCVSEIAREVAAERDRLFRRGQRAYA